LFPISGWDRENIASHKLNYMNKQILRLWIMDRLDKLTSTLSNLELHLDHGMEIMSAQSMRDRCNEIRGEEKVLKMLYDDFNLESTSNEEEIYQHQTKTI